MKKLLSLFIVLTLALSTFTSHSQAAEMSTKQITLTIQQIEYDYNDNAYYAITSADEEGYTWVLMLFKSKQHNIISHLLSKALINKDVVINCEIDNENNVDIINFIVN